MKTETRSASVLKPVLFLILGLMMIGAAWWLTKLKSRSLMTYALFKASWNPESPNKAVGGICGTAFFVDERTALTAHHVLPTSDLSRPNDGYSRCRFWLLGRNGWAIVLDNVTLKNLPEIDTTTIKFNKPVPGVEVVELSRTLPAVGAAISNQGYIESGDAKAKLKFQGNELEIDSFNLTPFFNDGEGLITKVVKTTFSGGNVNLTNVQFIITSYGGRKGMSGGPMTLRGSPTVIGLMSSGWPPDVVIKQYLGAVSATEIIKILQK